MVQILKDHLKEVIWDKIFDLTDEDRLDLLVELLDRHRYHIKNSNSEVEDSAEDVGSAPRFY